MLNCFQTGAVKAVNFVAADANLEEITLNIVKTRNHVLQEGLLQVEVTVDSSK
jgi:hypothetical protein